MTHPAKGYHVTFTASDGRIIKGVDLAVHDL